MSAESVAFGVVGILIGVLGTFAIFSGRVSTLEANDRSIVREVETFRSEVTTHLSGLTQAIASRGLAVRKIEPFGERHD